MWSLISGGFCSQSASTHAARFPLAINVASTSQRSVACVGVGGNGGMLRSAWKRARASSLSLAMSKRMFFATSDFAICVSFARIACSTTRGVLILQDRVQHSWLHCVQCAKQPERMNCGPRVSRSSRQCPATLGRQVCPVARATNARPFHATMRSGRTSRSKTSPFDAVASCSLAGRLKSFGTMR